MVFYRCHWAWEWHGIYTQGSDKEWQAFLLSFSHTIRAYSLLSICNTIATSDASS